MKPSRPKQPDLDLAASNPSAPPSHFRTPHTVKPVTLGKEYSRIDWYTSGAFWGLASLELIAAGAVGLTTRQWMGPEFLKLFVIVGASALLICWVIRKAWRDEWIVRLLGLLLFEAIGVARLLCSDHPGVKRYDYMLILMIVAVLLFLVRIESDDRYGRYRRSSWFCNRGCHIGGSSSSGGGGGGGGGGCGG